MKQVTLLPLSNLSTASIAAVALEACGLPLHWVIAWDGVGSLKEYLKGCYGMPMLAMTGGSIAENGTYSYPEDPDLQPLVKVEMESCTYYQYHYGIVAIVTSEGTFVCRMD